MNSHFKCIGIIGYLRHYATSTVYKILYQWLYTKGYKIIVEQQIAQELQLKNINIGTLSEIGKQADLAIVIGGDGNMLGAARVLANYDIKVIGVNSGNLGFLTDLNLEDFQYQLIDILNGYYIRENRLLLEVQIYQQNSQKHTCTAFNEVVFHSGKVACMLTFEVYIDKVFAFSQRSDGLIISTPTGSTAYAFSAGGPILMPSLNVIALIPMFPHVLSTRPIIISSDSIIHLHFSSQDHNIKISCDSQIEFPIQEGEDIFIRRYDYYLNLIHPRNYNYFDILSTKLGWQKN